MLWNRSQAETISSMRYAKAWCYHFVVGVSNFFNLRNGKQYKIDEKIIWMQPVQCIFVVQNWIDLDNYCRMLFIYYSMMAHRLQIVMFGYFSLFYFFLIYFYMDAIYAFWMGLYTNAPHWASTKVTHIITKQIVDDSAGAVLCTRYFRFCQGFINHITLRTKLFVLFLPFSKF